MNDSVVSTNVIVPEAPAISGLTFRHFRGEEDFPEMLATIHAAKLGDGTERSESLADIRQNYAHMHNCDPFRDVLIAEVNGSMAAYSRVWWFIDETSKLRIYNSFGFVRPEWRNQGLGRAMLHYNQDLLRAIAGDHPRDMERFFESGCDDCEKGAEALLISDGYQAVRHGFSMVRPDLENIPDCPLPEGLEVRPVLPEHYRAIWYADQEAFRDHWGFVEATEEDYQGWISHRFFQPDLWMIAWDGEQVAGQVKSYIDAQENTEYRRLRGYTEAISTRKPWRKRGVAHALIARSLALLKEKGMQEAALGVDTQNLSGALHVYEDMGFRVVRRQSIYRKKME